MCDYCNNLSCDNPCWCGAGMYNKNMMMSVNGTSYPIQSFIASASTGGGTTTITIPTTLPHIWPASSWDVTFVSSPVPWYPLPDFILDLYNIEDSHFKCRLCNYNIITISNCLIQFIKGERIIIKITTPNLRELVNHSEITHEFEYAVVRASYEPKVEPEVK